MFIEKKFNCLSDGIFLMKKFYYISQYKTLNTLTQKHENRHGGGLR